MAWAKGQARDAAVQLVQQQRRNRAEQQLSFSGSAAESSARGAPAAAGPPGESERGKNHRFPLPLWDWDAEGASLLGPRLQLSAPATIANHGPRGA